MKGVVSYSGEVFEELEWVPKDVSPPPPESAG